MDRSYFSMEDVAKHFMDEFTNRLGEAHKKVSKRFVAPENVHRLNHGSSWSFAGLADDGGDGSFKEHSTEINSSVSDIADHRIESLAEALSKASEDMDAQFSATVYGTISDACESSGNVVPSNDSNSLAESFYSMFEKIELSVDKNGAVQMPSLHVPHGAAEKIIKSLESAPEEFYVKIEALKEMKTQQALSRERERKSRFLDYGKAQ